LAEPPLVEREPTPLGLAGFSAEVRAALAARTDYLIAAGLARRKNQRVLFRRDLLATLRYRELDETARRITGETELPLVKAEAGASGTTAGSTGALGANVVWDCEAGGLGYSSLWSEG
jgi:hypothetical protein